MERVIVTNGTKVNLYTLFEDLQNYTQTNMGSVLTQLFGSFGISAATTISGLIDSSDTSLKVTGGMSHNYVSVASGDALTEALNYLYNAAGNTASVAGLSNGTHTLYLKHQYVYSDPVEVVSGFAYALSGINNVNSRAHDSAVYVWDVSPGVSGVVLADVPVNAGLVSGEVIDRRNENVLKLSSAVIPTTSLRTDRDYVQSLQTGLKMPSLELYSATISGLLSLSNGTSTVTLSVAQLADLLTRIHTQHTDLGTTSSYFRVGNSTPTANDGLLVATIPAPPMPPKNVRITDVNSPTLSRVRMKEFDAELAYPVRTGLVSHEAAVNFKWNYDNVLGNGGKGTGGVTDSGKFRITNTTLIESKSFGTNELTGYHLYFPVLGKDFEITANLASVGSETVLTVSPYEHNTIIDGIDATGTNYAIIHSNCERYELLIQPLVSEFEDKGPIEERYELAVMASDSPPLMQATENLFLGERVIVKVRAVSGNQKSAYTIMPSGSYTKRPPFVTVQPYSTKYLVKLPTIDSTGATVGANATATGFTVTIAGWDIATDFEVCYTTDASGPDFNNETHEKLITRQRTIDIPASGSRTYYIAARPLISGQQVADAKTTSVISGAGGKMPTDTALNVGMVSCRTFSGTIGTYSVGVEGWTLSTLKSPSVSGLNAAINESLIGEQIYVTSTATYYNISNVESSGGGYVSLTDTNGNLVTTGLAGLAFTINTTEFSRELWSTSNFPLDAQITAIHVDQWTKFRNNSSAAPVLRWYQKNMKDFANSIELNEKGRATYDQDSNVTILARNGARTLVVDLWDPTENDNISGFEGSIVIYWKPYTETGRRTDLTVTPVS